MQIHDKEYPLNPYEGKTQQVPWELDYNLLKNRGWGGGGGRFMSLDFEQLSWQAPNGNWQDVNGGSVGDIYTNYPSINLLGNGNMNANITKIWNIGDFPIQIKRWDVIFSKSRFRYTSWQFKLKINFPYRQIYWEWVLTLNWKNEWWILALSDWTLSLNFWDTTKSYFVASITITIT